MCRPKVLSQNINMERKPYHHGDLRSQLMELSERALEENNLENLSLRSLAKQAGVSHSAPYRHFKNKRALEQALLIKEMDNLHDAITNIKRNEVSPYRSLLDVGEYLCELASEHPSRFQLLASPIEKPAPARLISLRDGIFKELLRWTVSYLHEQGMRSQFEPVKLTQTLWTGLFGCASLAKSHWLGDETEDHSEALKILESFLDHILKSSH